MNASFATVPSFRSPKLLAELGFAEQLVLWAMRMWGAGYRLGHSPDDVLAQAFEKIGLTNGRQCLEEFMVVLTAGAARGIGLQCVCRKEIGEDEALLLDILRLSQRDFATGQAAFLLEDMLTRTALPIAAVKAQALAAAFNAANLRFPRRLPDAASTGLSVAQPAGQRAH
jgi:hypothetical protein